MYQLLGRISVLGYGQRALCTMRQILHFQWKGKGLCSVNILRVERSQRCREPHKPILSHSNRAANYRQANHIKSSDVKVEEEQDDEVIKVVFWERDSEQPWRGWGGTGQYLLMVLWIMLLGPISRRVPRWPSAVGGPLTIVNLLSYKASERPWKLELTCWPIWNYYWDRMTEASHNSILLKKSNEEKLNSLVLTFGKSEPNVLRFS